MRRRAGVIREGNLFDQPGSQEPGRGPARVLWPARYRALLETKRKVSVSAARPAAMFITSFLDDEGSLDCWSNRNYGITWSFRRKWFV